MSVWQIEEEWWTFSRARGMELAESWQKARIGVSVTADRTISFQRLIIGVAALEPAASAASATVESLPSALDHKAGPSKVAAPVKRKYEVDVKDREFCKRVRRAAPPPFWSSAYRLCVVAARGDRVAGQKLGTSHSR